MFTLASSSFLDIQAWLAGLLTGLGLFAAVGAQSAFILRQGLMRAHLPSVLLVCGLADAVVIFASALGLRALDQQAPWLMTVLGWGGAAFLTFYAWRSARRAMRASDGLAPAARVAHTRRGAVLGALAFTLLNPHFWLDMALVGALAHNFGSASLAFAGGAVCASVLWLLILGGGARLAAPLLRDARTWRVLDGGIAVVMAGMAVRLLLRVA
ncbi:MULTISPECIES: LysE/ArgO family amino acid transporter [unclassified Achromobacter]|uniref:LysE/ArgO family amino acid transporter n=1 Tax=unclassified Achromobacter TaxID=2626865 RepID=UPI000B51DCCD|nr:MULTISPECIES: LysE family transporter [unclassified Achromobacter]OWT75825.1 lysine transporter LysE [Achromobacter sp. HZ28]OWT76485.1 lysine transporter LysE [Achromobacter sp. HZ34]